MKKVLCSILAFVFVIGIFFSAPITIEAFAVENEVVEKNTNLILPDEKTGIYRYQLTVDGEGYILHGPVINAETGAMHESITDDITLPSVHPDDNKPIVELADNAFKDAGGITSVTIPDNYKKIGAWAFSDCQNLETVIVEDGVEEIGMEAFSDCNKLSNISFPTSLKSVGRNVVIETAYYNNESNWEEGAVGASYCLYIGDCLVAGELYNESGDQIKLGTRVIADYALIASGGLVEYIRIPYTVEFIGECGVGYFENNNNYEKIENFIIKGSALVEGENAAEVYAEKESFEYEVYDFDPYFQYKLNDAGDGYIITDYTYRGWFESVEIPAQHNDLPVKQVGCNFYPIFQDSNLKSVYIPKTVEVLDGGLFQNCSNLNEIIIPEKNSLKEIGPKVFNDTAYFNNEENWEEDGTLYLGDCLLSVAYFKGTEYTIKENTKGIASGAFDNTKTEFGVDENGFTITELKDLPCNKITKVNIPEKVEVVSSNAFSGGSQITTITGGGGIVRIGDSAFELPYLNSFTLGDKVEYIGNKAFYWAGSSNPGSTLELNIPETVKYIGDDAFANAKFEAITLPSDLEHIGERAFDYCYSLKKVTILSKNLADVPTNVFEDCGALTEIVVDDSCKYLSVENNVLYNKDKTKVLLILPTYSNELTISENLTELDIFNLKDCNAITEVTVNENNPVFSSVDGVLYNKAQTRVIFCPRNKTSVTLPTTVTEIGEYAFQGCSMLTSISGGKTENNEVLSTNVEKIEQYAFYNCNLLTDISAFSNIVEIGEYAFQYAGIEKLEFENVTTLKTIGNSAFSCCANLTTVFIPDSVETIGNAAFGSNTALTTLVIGEGYKKIGDSAFSGSSSLTNIKINGDAELGVAVFNDGAIFKDERKWDGKYLYIDDYLVAVDGNLTGDIVLKDGTRGFYPGFFGYKPYDVTSITIPGSVTVIPDYAFSQCTEMTSLTIEDGVKILGEEIIYCCRSLEELEIPASVEKMSGATFGSESVTIKLDEENQNYCVENGFILNSEKDRLVKCILTDTYVDNIKVPDTVEVIETYAFIGVNSGCVEIPSSVKEIAEYAFSGRFSGKDSGQDNFFSSANNIKFSEGLETIGNCAFAGAYFEEIKLPNSLKTIGDEAFSCCEKLKEIVLSENLEKIGKKAFYNCRSLEYLDLPSSLKSIGSKCFEGCEKIEIVNISENLQKIPSRCFAGCASLEYVNYNSENLKEISPSAFFGCVNYLTIAVPDSVEEIGSMALGYGSATPQAQTFSLRSRFLSTPKKYLSSSSESGIVTIDDSSNETQKDRGSQISGVKIVGAQGSESELYAKQNDMPFADVNETHVHTPIWVIVKEPTCNETGSKVLKCTKKDCEKSELGTEVIVALDHSYSDWGVTTEPTCSKQGVETQCCSKCGDTQTRPVATIAHAFSDGICSVCNVNKNDLISLKPYGNNLNEIKVYHKDGAKRIAITFSADTYLQGNDFVYIYAEKKNENQTYGDIYNNYSGDSSIVEYKYYYQNYELQNKRVFIHDTDTVVVRLVTDGNTEEWTEPNFEIVNVEYFTDECSHENKKTVGAYSAVDCGSRGHTGKVICANNDCQKVFDEGTYIQLPHTVTNWTITNEPTCYNEGQKMGVCDVCGNNDYQNIDMLSHTFGEWEKQSEPTCMNYGTLYRKCTNNNCGYQECDSSSLTPVGHSYGEWIISWEPTCENNGYKYRYCIYDCGVMQEEWTEPTDHKGEWVITESTCTSSGKKVFDCTVDGCDYYTEEKIQKLPHNFGEDGLCTSCGKFETECIETPDPYTESAEFKIYKENATRIKITFSEDTELYWGDYIYIYDEEATGDRYYNDIDDMGDINYVACGYRDSLAGKSLVVESDTIIIRLVVMDENYENCRGFALTNVEYFYDECNHSGTKVINQKEATCTEKSYSGDTVCANDSCLKLIEAGTYGASLGHNFDGNTCSRCGTGMWSYYFYDDMEDEPSEIVINGYLGDETEITIPSEINGYKVVGIASNAFSYKEDIKTVIIPEGVTYIGYGAFEYCEQLENVTISSTVKSIERYAFYGCNKLNVEIVSGNPYFTVEDNIIFNKDKTEINYVVNCDDVVFEVPNGVTKITSGCFNGMDKTKTIVIPATVEIIDNSVFEHCSIPLKNIVVSKDNKNYSSKDGVLYNKNGTTLICCPKNNTSSLYIPNGVKTIESNAISGDFVKFVSIPNSVETIENNAFSNCYNLTSFVIGTGLKIIGDGVFCSMWNGEGESIHVVYAGSEAQWNAIEKGEENYDLNNSKIHYNSTETILGNWSSVEQGDGCDSVSTNRTCECGFNQYDWVSGEHCYGETTTVIASTCVDNGIATKTCAECEVVECVILPLAEHKSVNVGTVGIHTKCSVCGVTTSTKHTYKETIQDSSCTAKGIKTFTCDCGYSYTVDVDKKAHTPINGGEKGIHSKCKDCGATLSTQHTYSRSETKATCEKAGTVKFSCSCGYYYTETTKATGHNSNTKITGKAATCTATGLTEGAKCSVCGKVTVEQKEIAKLAHNSNTKIPGKAATCTATGLTEGAKCSVCGTETKAQQVIPATGHNSNTKIAGKAATCTATGLTEGAKCSICGTVTKAQQTVPATGHKPALVGKKDATTKEAGYTGDKVCSVCNAVTEKGTAIPKIIATLATPSVTIKNTSKGIEVSWNAIENAKSYVVYRRVYDATAKKWSGWKKLKTGHTSTSYVDGTVVLGTGYRYTVRAVNGDVMSAYTSTKTLKYDVKPTVKISNVSNGVKVTWTTAANATGYTVYSSTYNTKTKKWSNWSNRGTAKATSTSWVDKKASSGVQYKYTVRACNGTNIKSSYKASANLIYLAQPTVKIANASNGVRVSWNKIAGATSYYVYSAQFNPTTNKWSNWTNRGSVTTTSWTDTVVQSGVTYRYTVRAINGKTLSSYKATAGLIYLAQPTVKIANASIGVRVSWSQSAGASGYTVYRAELVNGKWSNWKNMGTAKAEKSSWVDKSAKSGTKYKYTVRAVNGSVRSTYKATGELLYLAQPTVTVKAVSNGINVAWTQCTGAKGYTVYRAELVNGKWSNWKNMGTAKAEKSSWVDKSATAGVTYRYTVRAVNGKVRSTYVASTNVNR